MKTRSKIFTTADVQAILDKRKTMFREPVKPQPIEADGNIYEGMYRGYTE